MNLYLKKKLKVLIQEDLPFIKAETNQDINKTKFKLPSIDLLKILKKRKENLKR